jgi:hypothetical protein
MIAVHQTTQEQSLVTRDRPKLYQAHIAGENDTRRGGKARDVRGDVRPHPHFRGRKHIFVLSQLMSVRRI